MTLLSPVDSHEASRQQRIALFIPDLSTGGSERQLLELARGMSRSKNDILIITIKETGEFLQEARTIPNIKVIVLRRENPLVLIGTLLNVVRREQVGLVYSFLSVAQFYSLAVKFFLPGVTLVHRIADTINPNEYGGVKNRFVTFVLLTFARQPDFYILNSQAAKVAKAFTVPADKFRVVHNGIDTDRFEPNIASRGEFRRTHRIGEDVCLVGWLGSFSVYKDHWTFIEAAKLVKAVVGNVCFLTIGDDTTALGREAHELVGRAGMESYFRFLGSRMDVETILPACDIGCSSSVTEGFPNAVGEFMACGVPCVVTDVGDSSLIVGQTGLSTPKSNPRALADCILRLARLPPEERMVLGQRARRRVLNNFSVSRMVAETQEILADVRSRRLGN